MHCIRNFQSDVTCKILNIFLIICDYHDRVSFTSSTILIDTVSSILEKISRCQDIKQANGKMDKALSLILEAIEIIIKLEIDHDEFYFKSMLSFDALPALSGTCYSQI